MSSNQETIFLLGEEIVLPKEFLIYLKKESIRMNVSIGKVLIESLANQKLIQDCQNRGAILILREKDKPLYKLTFP